MAEKVRLASIGLGWWGGILADAVTTSGKGEVVTCFARTPETRQAFAEKRGFVAADSLESILQDESIDGVIIATSHESHLPLIQAAAAAGKHVFVEKPLTLTPADGRAAIDAAKAGGVLLQTG
ncbi:MAG: Gfo/Idh/MocA family oxidoreductase, partial [Acidimicrobiia bacterium]|nr:Gfo/Idh/MocA family oxidoreductase [Acidimicrobiia bacterium]